MKSMKLVIVTVAFFGLLLMATANAEYRTLRQDRPVVVYEDHPWGGEVSGSGNTIVDKVIIPDLIGTPFGFVNDIRIFVLMNNATDDSDGSGLLPDDFGDNGDSHHNGQKGN
ncbi:MAG: hypothetical protein ABIJ45_11910 [Candidatus Zixiibacteriota bacterium]